MDRPALGPQPTQSLHDADDLDSKPYQPAVAAPAPHHHHHHQNNAFYHHAALPLNPPITPTAAHLQAQLQTQSAPSPQTQRAPSAAPGDTPKRTVRLRKACDSCGIRKVKCDESGPPCKACLALDIPCTFDRPSRRRGPPNRHAEAIKRQKLGQNGHSSSQLASPVAPSPSALPSLLIQSAPLSAESIAPLELINALIDDFFTYIHPVTPFPHETWFRQAFSQRRDVHDRPFVALLAGMIGSLVSSFPRRPLKRITQLNLRHVFPTALSLVQRCQQVVHEARGTGYLSRPDLNIYDAVTCYFMVCMHSFTYELTLGNLYLGECYNILRVLGQHKVPADQSQQVNYIEQEVARRLYWTVFVTVLSSRSMGVGLDELFMHVEIPGSPHPPLPLEVDDRYIFPDHIEPQHREVVPRITGFNLNVRVYLVYDPLRAAEVSYGIKHSFDWTLQKNVLQQCLANVKQIHNSLPDTFAVWRGINSRSPTGSSASSTLEHTTNNLELHPTGVDFIEDESRRYITYEIQKANIHASLLTARSDFAERYYSICEAQQTSSPNAFEASHSDLKIERESIASDLLAVLSSIRPLHMEPNCLPFCMKIRQIAATLLPSSNGLDNGIPDQRAQYYLRNFMEILTDLEKSGEGSRRMPDAEIDEEEEEDLRKWANLRECQRAFAEKGGVLGKM